MARNRLHIAFAALGLVAIQTIFALRHTMVLFAGTGMYVVAAQARHGLLAEDNNVAHVVHNMPVRAAQHPERTIREIDLEITEQIVARHKGVGIGPSRALRFARPHMTLRANGYRHAG